MKFSSFSFTRVAMPLLFLCSTVLLFSFDHHQGGDRQQEKTPTDTIPQNRERKVRDLDEALGTVDQLDLKMVIDQAMASVSETMKQLDAEKLQAEAQRALASVDMDKIKLDIEKAMKEIDFQKIQADVQSSLAAVDWNEIKEEIEKVKKINMTEIEEELRKAKKEIESVRPEIEKSLAEAKVQIEKAKTEIREYKTFVDGLEKDGLIDKDGDYSIRHKNGKLIVNGKVVSKDIYNKNKTFLEKHPALHIEKNNDGFDMDDDNLD